MEIVLAAQVPTWPTANSPAVTGFDPAHGEREPFMGRGAYRQAFDVVRRQIETACPRVGPARTHRRIVKVESHRRGVCEWCNPAEDHESTADSVERCCRRRPRPAARIMARIR